MAGEQASVWQVARRRVSLGTISAIVQEAHRRAQAWLGRHAPPSSRPLALDARYGNDRRGASLHVVDTARWAVWAAEGPGPVDTESWTVVRWLAQARGLRWPTTISAGGAAIEAAVRAVDPTGQHRRAVWPVLHVWAQVQGRLDRRVTQLEAQTASVPRPAARVAGGQRPVGRTPRTDLVAHRAGCSQARATADALRFLTTTLHHRLEVVVLTPTGLLDAAGRAAELTTRLALLDALAAPAPPVQPAELARLHRHSALALPDVLAFAPALDRVQHDAAVVLGTAGVALVAWACARGPHAGVSPLHLSGLTDAPADWLVALGYPPLDPHAADQTRTTTALPLAA